MDALLEKRGVFIDARIKSFAQINIPVIEDIPYIGEIVSGQNILVYFSIVVVAAAYVFPKNALNAIKLSNPIFSTLAL